MGFACISNNSAYSIMGFGLLLFVVVWWGGFLLFGVFKYSYSKLFCNLYPKLLRLPQKYHDTEGSLVFTSIAEHGSRSYSQSLLLICTLAEFFFFFFPTLDYRSHNFAGDDSPGTSRNRRALYMYCNPPVDTNLKVIHQLSAQGLAGVYVLLSFYPSSWAVLKKGTGSSLAKTALLNMYYPTSIFI